MKKTVLTILASLFSILLYAQDIYVYSSTGAAEVQKGSQWNRLKKRDVLSADDVIRIGQNSCLTLLDKRRRRCIPFRRVPLRNWRFSSMN